MRTIFLYNNDGGAPASIFAARFLVTEEYKIAQVSVSPENANNKTERDALLAQVGLREGDDGISIEKIKENVNSALTEANVSMWYTDQKDKLGRDIQGTLGIGFPSFPGNLSVIQ
jgi:hypothetical protein